MIVGGMTIQGLKNFATGVNQAGDSYMMALYDLNATLMSMTAKYTPNGEVKGQGYERGGRIMTGYKCLTFEDMVCLDWDNPLWPNCTISARAGLIYNASKGMASVAIVDLGDVHMSRVGPFEVLLPEPGPDSVICFRAL
jgi:hypothetical protein